MVGRSGSAGHATELRVRGGVVLTAFTASGGAVGEDLCFTMMVNDDDSG